MKKLHQFVYIELIYRLVKPFFVYRGAIALFLTALILFPLDLFSQRTITTETIKRTKFVQALEIVAGPSFPYAQRKFDNSSHELKIGYAVKVTLIHPLSKQFDLCPSFLFERKGIKSISTSTIKTVRITGDRTNDYLTLSLVPRYIMGKQSRLTVGIGGYISLLKSSRTAYVYDSATVRRQYYGATEPHYKKYDFGISLEIGYVIPLKRNNLITIQILNNNGLMDVDRYDRQSSFLPSLVSMSKNNTISLLVGLRLRR